MTGAQHEFYTTGTIALTAPLLGALAGPQEAFAYAGGAFLGLFLLSPDLDLESSRASRRWGVLSLLWAPYRWLHPHRGASHTYLYGPLSRLGYLGLLVWAVDRLVGAPLLESARAVAADHPGLVAGFLAGYLLSQWAHLWQDGIRPQRRWTWKRNGQSKRRISGWP